MKRKLYTNRGLLLIGIGGIALAGCGGGNQSSQTTTPAATPAAPSGAGGSQLGMSPFGMGFGAGSTTTAAATPAPAAPPTPQQLQLALNSGPQNAQDPFLVTWKKKPLPPDVFEEVNPLQVASLQVEAPPSKPVYVREVPDRRVAGIMTGNGVYAILEQNGVSEVVKPGAVTADGYKVIAINPKSVKLEKREGNLIFTQDVKLSDISTASYSSGGGYPGAGSSPGFGGGTAPGGFPGRPGLQGPGGGNPGGFGGGFGGGSK